MASALNPKVNFEDNKDRESSRKRRRLMLAPLMFVGPYLIFLVAFGFGPSLYGLFTSFVRSGGTNGTKFVGLSNWIAVFRDYRFVPSIVHVGFYLLVWLPVLILLVLVVGLALHARPGRFSSVMRLIYLIPGAVTGSAAALLWLFMATPRVSPVSPLLRLFGISSFTDAVTGWKLVILLAIMGLAMSAGGWIVIIYGALRNLSQDVVESAAVDGCSAWQLAWHIKLPLLRRYIILILVMTFAVGTQLFVEPTVLAMGAPGAISPTWSINQLAYYYATQDGRFGQAAALSIALLVIGLIAALILTFRTHFYSLDAYD